MNVYFTNTAQTTNIFYHEKGELKMKATKIISTITTLSILLATIFALPLPAYAAENQNDNPATSIELLNDFKLTYKENLDGSFGKDLNGNEMFDYSVSEAMYEAEFLITFKDGTSKTAHPYEEVNGETLYPLIDQPANPWTPGGDNYISVFYGNLVGKIPVVIIPSPVKSIEVVTAPNLVFYENQHGYYNTDVVCRPVFFYDVFPEMLKDVQVKINFKNGKSRNAKIGDCINGELVDFVDNQYFSPWNPVGDNYITITYLDKSVNIPVKVIPSDTHGDINGDGNVDTLDSVAIKKYAVGKLDLTYEQLVKADVNYDFIVDVLDATAIQKRSAELR